MPSFIWFFVVGLGFPSSLTMRGNLVEFASEEYSVFSLGSRYGFLGVLNLSFVARLGLKSRISFF